MKSENKEAVKELLGEFAIQLLIVGLGGVGLACVLIGWGMLWLLLPFGFISYLLINRLYKKTDSKSDLQHK